VIVEFDDLIRARYSCRSYKPDAIDQTTLDRLLAAAVLAPTAANRQPFRLIVVHTAGRQDELRKVYGRDWFVQAPLVICACGLKQQGWVRRVDDRSYTDVDVTIAMDHLILAAANLGLGTCWIAAFDPTAVRRMLALPADVEPIVLTPLGYPADRPGPKERKPASELVRYERW
jgi:nitroreductase